jgi:lysophospholipase L1-like esterase
MKKKYLSIITTLFKLSASLLICFFIIELLEIYLWPEKTILNPHGYRDKKYSYKKPDGIFRILVLGDSQTFGQGLKKLEDTWHKKLEVLMNKDLKSPKFEIITLSGKGWNTDTQLYELFNNGFRYNPDLILLGFNHNDVPAPHFFKCNHQDVEFFAHSNFIKWIRRNSRIYQLTEFRINRLLEKLENKPGYVDCLNQLFDSRGWDMEKIYLDTILMSAQLKDIHFMLITLPFLHKLGDDYPLKKPHQKIKAYCNEKEIECLDLYEKGFKGLSSTSLKVSITDRHLNKLGTEIVAQELYKALKPLKNYKNLSLFNRAFSLFELLNDSNLPKKIDDKWDEFSNKLNSISAIYKNKKLTVQKDKKKFIFDTEEVLDQKTIMLKVYLDQNGNFISWKKSFYFPSSPNKNSTNSLEYKNGFYDLKQYTSNPNQLKSHKRFVLQAPQKNIKLIQLEENIFFEDPKTTEEKIFSNTYHPSESLTIKDKELLIKKLFNNNPKLKLKYFKKPLTEQHLNSNKLVNLLDENFLSGAFLVWLNYGAKTYVDQLVKVISEKKPSSTSLKAVANYYSFIREFDKLTKLKQENPSVFNNS